MTDTTAPARSRITRREFGNGGHVYALDGRRCPGVTTIIRNSAPAGGLLNWYARQAAEWAAQHGELREELGDAAWIKACANAANDARDKAADRGRAIHAAAEKLVDGEPVDVPAEIAERAGLVLRFLDTWRANVLARECVVYHGGHRYAGQFDLIAELADGNRWLLDYKTGSGIFPDVALQLAAYRNAEFIVWNGTDRPMPRIDKTGVVHITENGFELIPIDSGPDVWATFVSALPLYRFHGTKFGYDRIGEAMPDPEPLATVTHIATPEVTP
jgi:hypothetical protein